MDRWAGTVRAMSATWVPGSVTHERITLNHWGERGSLTLPWGRMSAYLLRLGETVYACTFFGGPQWKLWRRTAAGAWTPGASGAMMRPALMLAAPDGRLHIIAGGVLWTSRRPGGIDDLQARALPAVCGTMIYTGAAINAAGDILIVFVNPAKERELMTGLLPNGADDWIVGSIGTLEARYCYPQIHFVGDKAHVFVVEDELVHDPEAKWGPQSGHYYRFHKLRYAFTEDVRRGVWQHQLVHEQDDGFVHTADILALPDGSVHCLSFGHDRSLHGAVAPDSRGFLLHMAASSPGSSFETFTVAEGHVNPAGFRPDGLGGWHYVYGEPIAAPEKHPHTGLPETVYRHVYSHRAAPGKAGSLHVIDLPPDTSPGVPFLLRSARFGGQVLPDALELLWEDPWIHEGSLPDRAAHYSRIALDPPD